MFSYRSCAYAYVAGVNQDLQRRVTAQHSCIVCPWSLSIVWIFRCRFYLYFIHVVTYWLGKSDVCHLTADIFKRQIRNVKKLVLDMSYKLLCELCISYNVKPNGHAIVRVCACITIQSSPSARTFSRNRALHCDTTM